MLRKLRHIEEALKWVGVMMFTGHIPSHPIPKLIQDALDDYKRQHPDERVWP